MVHVAALLFPFAFFQIGVDCSPLPHEQEALSCDKVNDILALIKNGKIQAEATSFCSSYISIPVYTVTRTLTSRVTPIAITSTVTSTFSPPHALVTSIITTTPATVFVTKTNTITPPATLTTTISVISSTTTATTTVNQAALKRNDDNEHRYAPTPKMLKPYIGAKLSSVCSCLSIPQSTVSASVSITTTLVPATVVVSQTASLPTLTDTTVTTTKAPTPTSIASAETVLIPATSIISTSTIVIATSTKTKYDHPRCTPAAIGSNVFLRRSTDIDFIAGIDLNRDNAPVPANVVMDTENDCCSICQFTSFCYVWDFDVTLQ
ncbi:hypothetical protein BGZ60DRAFT_526453 [Tricladium varicosporioides]|nr:hypothetical protein BGZ60DRAFT_526453 [Hymenoscyphus varicosporioides]